MTKFKVPDSLRESLERLLILGRRGNVGGGSARRLPWYRFTEFCVRMGERVHPRRGAVCGSLLWLAYFGDLMSLLIIIARIFV